MDSLNALPFGDGRSYPLPPSRFHGDADLAPVARDRPLPNYHPSHSEAKRMQQRDPDYNFWTHGLIGAPMSVSTQIILALVITVIVTVLVIVAANLS